MPDRTTMTAYVVNEIRRRILSGEIAAGTKIPAGPLAEELGVSPVPVREALQALQSEGLVKIFGHRGAIAAPASSKELADLYQMREILEPAAVSAVDLTLLRDRLDTLTDALERLDHALHAGDRDAFRVAHREFHFGIYACSGNDWMVRTIRGLYDNCERYRTAATWRRDPNDAASEHRFMLDALREARADDAAQLTLAHLEVTRGLALSSIQGDESKDAANGRSGGKVKGS
ncbi:MAG: Transcriptional regulator [Marmoricola sp.]|jgi:DNA-binding GntR family transcriptional regulator|nr:Transcriptional regulator [Marmoricola sp.]